MESSAASDQARRTSLGVFAAFAGSGLAFSTWASRLPDIKSLLGLTPGQLGLLLLVGAAGSLLGMPSAGRVITALGARFAIRAGVGLYAFGILIAAVGVDLAGRFLPTAFGMFWVGLGIGLWDVAMNHQAARVETLLGRTIMPWFHAAFSAATVLSALIGALASWAGVDVLVHLGVMAVLLSTAVLLATGWLPTGGRARQVAAAPRARTASAWREPRTLMIGLVTLVAAFTEGTANDWIAVAMVEGHQLPVWAGVLGFATFLSAMTAGRVFGVRLLDRFGRVRMLIPLFVLAALGCLLVVVGNTVLAFLGAVVWGLGASMGFPVGMSAAGDDPLRAAARISVVATIGYLAFLGGPPLLGALGDRVGVLHALLVVGVLSLAVLVAVPFLAEQRPAGPSLAEQPPGGPAPDPTAPPAERL